MLMDELPDLILLDLLEEAPQLALVSRRFYALAEARVRRRLLPLFEFDDQLLDAMAAEIRSSLRWSSWTLLESILNHDYWFFGPEHVTAPLYLDASRRCHRLEGCPWGLYVPDWNMQALEYRTKLRAGRYDVVLDLFVPRRAAVESLNVAINGARVTQHFRRSLSLETGSVQGQQGRLWDAELCGGDAVRLVLGTLTVAASPGSSWAEVTVRVEDSNWDTASAVLNFMCFRRHGEAPRGAAPSTKHDGSRLESAANSYGAGLLPTHTLLQLYQRVRQLKCAWSPSSDRHLDRPLDRPSDRPSPEAFAATEYLAPTGCVPVSALS